MVRVMLAETPRRLTRISRTLRAAVLARTACVARKDALLTRVRFLDGTTLTEILRTILTWISLTAQRLALARHSTLARDATLPTSLLQSKRLRRWRTVLLRKVSQCMTRTIRTVHNQALER